MTTKYRSIIFASALFAALTLPVARAQVLFNDSFNTTPSTNINDGIGAPRQTGSLVGVGGVSYTEGSVDDGFRAQVSNNNNPGLLLAARNNDFLAASPNLDFQSDNYSISFGVTLANVTSDFSYIDFGGSNRAVFVNQPDQLGLLFEPNGTVQFFDSGALVTSFTDANIGSAPLSINIRVVAGQVSLFVNGNQENISGTTGAGNSYSALLTADNYITLGQYQDPSSSSVNPTYFTNLQVTDISSAPEPSSVVLTVSGLLVLAVLVRRRKLA